MIARIFKQKFFKVIVTIGFCILMIVPAYGATYYVRVDGGSANQCTGLKDAPYPGSGKNKDCALSHPFWVISPIGNNPTKMIGGDTLIIDGSNGAQYKIGYGAPNSWDTTKCHTAWPYNCFMRGAPSGPDPANPTRILGKGWDSGCQNPPQLWGTERVKRILNLEGTSNVEVQCLEITDHSECQEFGPNACKRKGYPLGDWGETGLYASDSNNAFLNNINIHGTAFRGIQAGRLSDWTIEDVKIVANSFVGWDGDIGANISSNSGTISFNNVQILFNGCGETYPGLKPYDCYSQNQGGYGDGLGTHKTGGNWIFNNVDISHNVSDGLDLLYHDGSGTITIKRSRFEGNAGNQVKVAASTTIENSILIGNCGYFADQPITWESKGFNHCRARGNTLAIKFRAGINVDIINSTITGNGDTILLSTGWGCVGGERIFSRNKKY